ncbi:MAG: fluoride efflux transporter CrcB [Actinobacteria bacterium HGW-Actinobacteria-10]|jgi:CrcB protein|nr:MAG: fluoride efflux transporter CrcB [Actinobacteria bacterium HGW-Actinobacteria-10]
MTVRLTGLIQVVTGAGIGGGLRYLLGAWTTSRWGTGFPWHTLAINVVGAFLLGVLIALSVERHALSRDLLLFVGVGVLGGFTTFSTLSYESVALVLQGNALQGIGYMFGSAALGLVACAAGLLVGKLV